MKNKLIIAIWFVVVFVCGGVLGSVVQHLKTGYRHKVWKTESFPFPDGEVTLDYMFESVGISFLDPETSVLTIKTKYGLPIVVYKAKRMFQESCPHAQDVKTEENLITWQDGINTYRLTVNPMKDEAEPNAAPLPSEGAPSEGR